MKKIIYTLFAILGFANFTMAQLPGYVPASGLVAFYPFNGNANDVSGNGKNGTNNGATLTTDRFSNPNSAYGFNGTSNYLNMGTYLLNAPSSYSISCWAKFAAPNNFSYLYSQATNGEIQMFTTGNGNVGTWSKLSNGGSVSAETVIIDTINWHHIVGIYDGTNSVVKIFMNGNLLDSASIPAGVNIASHTGSALIGRQSQLSANFFNGKLDDIGIWNRALTQTEVSSLYRRGCLADTITTQPTNQIGNKGSNKTFSFAHSGTGNSYQWQSNAAVLGWQNVPNVSSYTGATTNSLTVNNLTVSNHNQLFRVVTSKTGCKDTSNAVSLTLANIATDSLRLLRLQADSSRLTNDSILYLTRINKLSYDSLTNLGRITNLKIDSINNKTTISLLNADIVTKGNIITFLQLDSTNKGITIRQLQTDLANKHDTVYIASVITSDTLRIAIHTGILSTSPIVNSLKVYPNPASTLLHIDLEKPGYFIAKLSSITGQSIITPTSGTIDVSSLANGVYILTIYDSNNKLISTNKVAIIK